ncbi:MAG: winged helix-turn-helix transcriptional regulator [Bdellovibrionales bacterium]
MAHSKTDCRLSGCPIAFTLDLIGDRWSLLIIRDMLFLGKQYYGEFLESPEKIATNILAERLKRLEDNDIISKRPDPESQKKIIYEMTKKGLALIPMILEMISWGAKHDPNTAAPPAFIRDLKRDKVKLAEDVLQTYLKRKRKG